MTGEVHVKTRQARYRQVFSEGELPDLNLGGGVQINSVDQMGNAPGREGRSSTKAKKYIRM